MNKGDLEFYPNGDYQIFYGDVYWSSLEAKKKMIRILPLDYQELIFALPFVNCLR